MSLKTGIWLTLLSASYCLFGKERVPYLRFYMDLAWSPILDMRMHQQYQGEFYPFGDPLVVNWSELDERQRLVPGYGYWNISGHFGANFWKGLYLGLRYNIMQINGLSTPGLAAGPFLDVNSSFFFLYSLQAGYVWQPIQRHPQWTIMPMAGMGSYFANDYFAGKGRKWLFNAQVKTSYLFKERYGIFMAPGFAIWQHKDKGYSNVFERNTLDKVRLQQIHLETGFSFRIHIDRKP